MEYWASWLKLPGGYHDEQNAYWRPVEYNSIPRGLLPLPVMPSRKTVITCSLISYILFLTPKCYLTFLQQLKKCLGQILLSPVVYAVWRVLELLVLVWFMVSSYPRSVHPNSFSFFKEDMIFLPTLSQCWTHVLHSFSRKICDYTSFNSSFNISVFLSKQSPFNVSAYFFWMI